MRTTAAQLEKLYDLLTGPKIDLARAVALLKEELVKGPCHGEVAGAREACLLLLERLIRPGVAGQREGEALVERMGRVIHGPAPLGKEGLLPMVDGLAGVLKSAREGEEVGPSPLPDGFAERLLAGLKLLGEGEAWLVEEITRLEGHEGGIPWEEIHFLLGRIVGQGDVARVLWQREREEYQGILAELTRQLGEILQQLGTTGEEMGQVAERMQAGMKEKEELPKLRERLLQEAGAFQKQASLLRQQAEESREAVRRNQERMGVMNQAMLQNQDENLRDPVSGLPNRFALAARLKRAVERSERLGEGCSLVVAYLDNLPELLKGMKGESGHKLVAALAGRLVELAGERGFVGRLSEERFCVLLREEVQGGMGQAEEVGQQIEALLRHTRFKSGGQAVQLLGRVGMAAHRPGMKAKELLQTAQEGAAA